MQLLAVCVGRPAFHPHQGGMVLTGIYKAPAEGRLIAGRHGLPGDGQADLANHGGADKALYAYTHENHAWWQAELGRDAFPYGQFGENLTVTGMPDESVHIGDRYRIGAALVEVTQPRVPCFKLGLRMQLPEFPRRFKVSGRVGFYLRVLEEGEIGAGDPIEPVRAHPQALSIREAMRALLPVPDRDEVIRRLLDNDALSTAWRQELEGRLGA